MILVTVAEYKTIRLGFISRVVKRDITASFYLISIVQDQIALYEALVFNRIYPKKAPV